MKFFRRALISIVIIFSVATGNAGDPVFLWPIDRPPMITGTFGEYRGPHFHHGIDVSTGGKTGYRVYAAADGYVSGVMYQQWGIGYALLVTHGNGWKTLYGHLERFDDNILMNEKIKGVAERILNRKDFRVDFNKPAIMVKKGAVIGYSGESGIGLEHFHFEVRKGDGEPVNPLINGITVADRNPPVINSVTLIPLNGVSRVDGSAKEKKFPVIVTGKNTCTVKAPSAPLLAGTVGIAVNAYDRIGIRNGVAPYGFDFFADNRLLYQIRYRRIERSLSRRVGLYYDYDHSSLSSYTMFLYDRTSSRGVIRAEKEGKVVEIRIVCHDAAENATTLVFQVKTGAAPKDPPSPSPNLVTGRSLELASADRQCSVTYPRGSALYDEIVTMETEEQLRVRIPGISSRSAVYSVSPTNLCIDRAAEIVIAYDGADYRKVGLYRLSRNGKFFSCIGSRYDDGKKAFRVPVMRMGKFFLASDNAVPRIRFRNGMTVKEGDTVRLSVSDIGSGLDLARAEVKVDGRDVAWDFDPDRRCIEILRHNGIWAKGKHVITARISDMAGNQSPLYSFGYSVR